MFITVLFTVMKVKAGSCRPVNEWIHKLSSICTWNIIHKEMKH